ncbi:hypothetical protein [Pelomonas sp. KK5]|nr:hypothetical protein [Pelomonas sp. KK5]
MKKGFRLATEALGRKVVAERLGANEGGREEEEKGSEISTP